MVIDSELVSVIACNVQISKHDKNLRDMFPSIYIMVKYSDGQFLHLKYTL